MKKDYVYVIGFNDNEGNWHEIRRTINLIFACRIVRFSSRPLEIKKIIKKA